MKWVRAVRGGQPVQERLRQHAGLVLDVRIHALPDGGFMTVLIDVTREMEAAAELQRMNETLERRVGERTAELTRANRLLRQQYEEQARAERDLRIAKDAAEEANRTKTRFLAAASHDLLQPINAAKLYISSLREQPDRAHAADTAERLERSFASIEALLGSFLEISRLDSSGAEFDVTEFRLDEVLAAVQGDMAAVAAGAGLELRVIPTRRWVRSDKRYLRRCIQNLVANAIQYTAEGRVLLGVRTRGETVAVEVWDTGIGISPEDQERIFDEFTRIGRAGSGAGAGLGLSIVQRACRHLGHRVGLRSEPGRGSVFSIDLPRAGAGLTVKDGPEPVEAGSEDALDRIILVVENDPDVLFATVRLLESWGASVLACASTREALEMMGDLGGPPDMILADYQLDDGDTGLHAIEALRSAAGQRIPAVMITAARGGDLVRKGEALDFAVLTKPVKLARLRALIAWKTRHLETAGFAAPEGWDAAAMQHDQVRRSRSDA